MRQILLFIIIICVSLMAKGQDKPPIPLKDSLAKKAIVHPDSTYDISFLGAGSINRTSTDITYLINNDLKFMITQDTTFALTFDNNWVYGTDHHQLTNNDYSSVLQFDLGRHKYKNHPHFYYWALANYNTSYSLKVNSQVLAGAGAAISIFDGAHVKLNLSDGPVFDQSSVVLPDSSHLSYHTVRNSFRIAFKFEIKDLIVIDGSDFLQNSFNMGSDYIIRSTTNLSLKINKWLQLTSSLLFNEQKRTESTNLLFTYGIKIDKSF
jgi:Protein of unknown function, DUF481